MKITAAILFSILTFSSLASDKIDINSFPQITIYTDHTKGPITCTLEKEAKAFLCPNNGNPILVKNSIFGFSALTKDADGSSKMITIVKAQTDEKTLFEIPFYNNSVSYAGMDNSDNFSNKSGVAFYSIEGFFRNDENPKDRSRYELGSPEFKAAAKTFFDEKEKIIELSKKVYQEKNYQVELDDGQKTNCRRDNGKNASIFSNSLASNFQCGFFQCDPVVIDGKKYSPVMFYHSIPFPQVSGLMFLMDENGIGPSVDVKKIFSPALDIPLVNNNALLTMEKSAMSENSETLKDLSIFIPPSLKKQGKSIFTLKHPGLQEFFQVQKNSCIESTGFQKFQEAQEKTNKNLAEAEMAELIHLVDGILTGNFVDPNKAAKFGCFYNGVFLTKEATQHMEEINKNFHPDNFVESTISMKKANELFQKAVKMDDIAWKYKQDGCYARAHLMARRFEAEGIHVDKVWLKGYMTVTTPKEKISWNFHVAPIVYVKDDDGKIQKIVIDPSLFDHPVTVEEWDKKMSKNTAGGSMPTAFPFPNNSAFLERNSLAFSSSDAYMGFDKAGMSEKDKMDMAKATMAAFKKVEPKE